MAGEDAAGNVRYVAFLRAVNVGGRTVTMAALRAHFAELGLGAVETVIASGNVLFDADAGWGEAALAQRIEEHLGETLGFDVPTFLRTAADVARLRPPRAVADGDGTLWVGFLSDPPGRAGRVAASALETPVDRIAVAGREIWWRRTEPADSRLTGASFERALRTPTTFRNVTTVRRLAGRDRPARGAAGGDAVRRPGAAA